MRRATLFAGLLCGLASVPSAAAQERGPITKDDRGELVSILQEIARAGRRAEALEIAAALPALGANAEERKAAEGDAYRLAAGAKSMTYGPLPGPGNKLKAVVKRLADAIRSAPEAQRAAAAAALARLDGTNADVRTWAGHTAGPLGWRVPEDATGFERRAALYAAARAAAKRDVQILIGQTRLALARNMSAGGAREYEHHGIHVHTTYAPDIAKAMLTEGVRGAWVLATLLGDGSVNTDGPKKREFNTVVVPTEGEYQTCIGLSSSAGTLLGGGAANAQARQFYMDKRQFVVRYALMPKFISSIIASRYQDPYFPPKDNPPGWFTVAVDQWVSLAYIKTPSGFYEQHGSVAAGSDEESLRLPRGLTEARERINAGLAGSWSICIANVRAGTDIPLQECLHNDRALVIGEKLAKATLFVQFLYERGWLLATANALIKAKGSTPEAWRSGTGHTIEELDRLWRSWVTGNRADLVSLLAPPKAPKPDRKATAFLKELNQARKDALFEMRNTEQEKPVALDDRLMAGARARAEVLNGGAGNELAAEAAWFSHVLKGPKKPKNDLPTLLADPAARCVLLDPGTRALGWHGTGEFGVVQAAPAVGVTWNWRVVWPPHNAKDVPRALPAAELPELHPALRNGERGYPVSLHLHAGAGKESIKLLELQERDGEKVECDLITWTDPKWSGYLRPYSYFLVPKAPLERKTLYDVTARAMDGTTTEWQFKTGR